MSSYNDLIYLQQVLDTIEKIEISVKVVSKHDFESSDTLRDATILRILIIGEAVKRISATTKENYPEVVWKEIAGTRDRMIHAYLSIDPDTLWRIIKQDLPVLKEQIRKIERSLEQQK